MISQTHVGLGELLRHLVDLVDQGAAAVYRQKALSYRPRYTPVMRVLACGPHTVNDITAQLSVTQGAVSQSLKLMEQDGLIVRRAGSDARQTMISLSDQGEALLGPLQTHWQATFRAIEQLEEELHIPLRSILQQAIGALEHDGFAARIERAEETTVAEDSSTATAPLTRQQSYFQEGGGNYAQYRPTYPAEVVTQLRKLCPSNTLAIDVGCGNGQFSVLLAEQFEQVLATDVSADQLAQASPRSNLTYRCEAAESMSVTDHSADLIVAAQAAHWFDLPRFYAEVRRVAKPGAVIALISYGIPHIPGVVNVPLQRYYWLTLAEYWPPERCYVETGYQEMPFPFPPLSVPDTAIERAWSLDQLVGYLGTWSATRRAITAGDSEVLNRCATQMRGLWGEADQLKTITWPVTVRAGRVNPRD